MSYDEPLVGSVALIFAVVAAAISAGPWSGPYQLRTVAAIHRRYGKSAARFLWLGVAITSFTAGTAILSGVRPSYAIPAEQSDAGSR